MTPLPSSVIYTQDPDLIRVIAAYTASQTHLRQVDNPARLEPMLDQTGPALLFMDVRAADSVEWVSRLCQTRPEHVVVALGIPRSDPVRAAEALGVYATEELQPDRVRFQTLVRHALDRLRLQQELHLLRQAPAAPPAYAPPARAERGAGSLPLHHFSRALRRFDDPEALLDSVVEGVASMVKVSRVGMFAQIHGTGPYRLRAAQRCMVETYDLEFEADHPLIHWLERHAHLVARSRLDHVTEPAERVLLKQALNALGAEILVPLFTRGHMTGWLFLGQRITGAPFDEHELEELAVIADHIATTLENAQLYEEVSLQKTLAETLFQSIPIGIVAVGADGFIRWFNDAAEQILNKPAEAILNQPVGAVGSRMADYLHRSFLGEPVEATKEWVDPETRRHISVQTHRLMDKDQRCLGAVALIHDTTESHTLREKHDQLERAAFWNELAASMSHEIRNPLVAIKTYAQLLPERYDDPEFRSQFRTMVSDEVQRLDKIIDQINSFAHPPAPDLRPIDISATTRKALQLAATRHPQNGIRIDTTVDPDLPVVLGDDAALSESIAHVVVNAMEALHERPHPHIIVSARKWSPTPSLDSAHPADRNGHDPAGVVVSVKDNGPGMNDEVRDKLFSPFCTTKARGMGLGLPIAKRTIIDHNGQIQVESGANGTEVTLFIPRGEMTAADAPGR